MTTLREQALRRLGWGLVLPMIDIHIIIVDLLPDFIGYAMIVSALHRLSSEHSAFRKAKAAAIALLLLSLPQLLLKSNIPIAEFKAVPIHMHLYGQAGLALHALMAYWLFNGLYAFARQNGLGAETLDSVVYRRNFYLSVTVLQLAYYPFLWNSEDGMHLLLFAFAALMLVAELLLLRLPFRLAKERKGEERPAN
ncbi:hypothetical protein [Paenibacillus arenilitoris]|uniref:Uncharacterized protein n=1 Tax=Paenibacillus arenilitoris TaxID=2772299 RepID=A0A927H756_9BACL|nr:hypothetical protein [Paenibacillus arenilitoris]MBD2869254.1 hypothetical protein [Paenibacillus arenilitoris]